MEAPLTAQSLLNLLGNALGMMDLQFNEDRVCRLVIDGSTVIDLEHVEEQQAVYLISVVAANLAMTLEVAECLLQANLFGRGTGGAVLSYDEIKDEVVLFQELRLTADLSERFVPLFESFLEQTESWSKQLLDLYDDASIETIGEEPPQGMSADYIRV